MAAIHLRIGAAFMAAIMLTAAPALAQTKLKIGAVMSLTGELADYGSPALDGVKLAVEEINKAGGVLGSPTTLAVGDDQTSPQTGVEVAHKLVSTEKVNALIGPLGSGTFISVARSVAIPAGLPIITGSATSPVISTLDAKGFVFRTIPSDVFQGIALAQVAHDKGYKSVGVIYVNNDYGKPLADSFEKAFVKAGGKVTAAIGFEPKQSSFDNEVKKASADHPEALLLLSHTGEGVPILKQALESGLFNRFLLGDGMMAPEIIDAVGGQFLDGAAGTAPAALPGTPGGEAFKAAYQTRYGALPPKPYIGSFYDAVYLIALATEKAKSTEGAKIRDAIRAITTEGGQKVGPGEFAKAKQLLAQGKTITYTGTAGAIRFDTHGDVGGSFAHWEIQDGVIVTKEIFEPKL